MKSSRFHKASECGGCCTRLEDVGVRLNGTDILQNIRLHVHCGELTAIVGPNGAGKTTLFRALINDVPYRGRIQFTHAETEQAFGRPRIGYVPQRLDIDRAAPVSVLDLFAGASSLRPLWLRRTSALQEQVRVRLAEVDGSALLNRRLGELSGGELQRVLLALALHPTPNLLLLDEPVTGMDAAGATRFYEMISRLRTQYDLSILIVTHDLDAVARIADRVLFINRTLICDGSPATVWQQPEFRQAFGLDSARAAQRSEPA